MSQYYNPRRNPNWNYGGKNWRLSRSKIDLFLDCKRCFYIDNKLGTSRPKGYPFMLNSAVDKLLKKEFDIHRSAQSQHPLMKEYSLDATPFAHPKIDEWRDALKGGIQYLHPETGMLISGGIDDVWVNPKGELIIVDYKATSKDEEVSLDAEWQDGYKRQMEIYQWLFRKNGFTVSDTGYFVYVNGQTDREAFDGVLEFDVKLIPYEGNTDWIEKVIASIKLCLDDPRIPSASKECDYCLYVETIGDVTKQNIEKRSAQKSPEEPKNTLF
jgi:CRISPR/Cas system-associated exonuclease Cas4 (RecB family)